MKLEYCVSFSEDEERLSNVKRARYAWHVILESESPQPTSSDEDDESIHSIQGVETGENVFFIHNIPILFNLNL